MNGHPAIRWITRSALSLNSWCAIAIGASIPISIALDNLFLGIVVLTWVAGLQYREKLSLAWTNPVYKAALLLFGMLLVGTAYGDAAPGDAKLYLSKYTDLALIPVLGSAFAAIHSRKAALLFLAGSLAAILLISCALKIGLIPPMPWFRVTPESPFVVFKLRLTHNILMAFAAFLFAWLSCCARSSRARFAWGILGALAVINITLVVEGATGYLALIMLWILFGWQRAGFRGMALAIACIVGMVALLSVIPGPFQSRVQQITQEMHQERVDRPASTSTGYRMEFYRNTLALIQKTPLFGTGTGSFPAVYAEQVKDTGSVASKNPHNEFMLITVQTGFVGLAALLWLFWQQWRFAPQLPTPLERNLAQGLVLMMILICMLNSSLLDHTEGLLFAWLTALLYAGLKSDDYRVIR
jgi:O-antigen ligase